MNSAINILLAMPQQKEDSYLDNIRNDFQSADIVVGRLDIRSTKAMVQQYLTMFQDTDILIVTQHQLNDSYSTQELDALSMSVESLCIVPILDEKKGSDYLKQLDSSAIYTALFQDDADYAAIADLILNGRGKKEARVYYGIIGNMSISYAKPEFDVDSSVRYLVSASQDYVELESRLSILSEKLDSSTKMLEVLSKLPDDVFLLASRMSGYKELCRLLLEKKQAYGLKEPEARQTEAETMRKRESVFTKKSAKPPDLDNGHLEAQDFGFISTAVGVGCTYTAILMAHTLAKSGKKVAIVEFDDCDGHFERLCLRVNENQNITGMTEFIIGTVHYFYHIPYSQFCVRVRPCYDYIVYDFGCASDTVIEKFVLKMDLCFVIAGAGDWHLKDLLEFTNETQAFDREHRFTYLIPFAHQSELPQYMAVVGENTVASVICEPNPYQPSKDTCRIFKSLIMGRYKNKKARQIGFLEKSKKRYRSIGEKPSALKLVLCLALCILFSLSFGNGYYKNVNKRMKHDLAEQKKENLSVVNENGQLKKQLEQLYVISYSLKENVPEETVITEDLVNKVPIYSSLNLSYYLGEEDLGAASSKIALQAGVPLLKSMVDFN